MLRISEAAVLLGLSKSSVRKLCDSGKLASVRPMGDTGHRRILESEIDAFVAGLGGAHNPDQQPAIPPSGYRDSRLSETLKTILG